MIESFLLKPFFALILIATSCSLFGVFVLWKKLSYFGDALSHSILLGLVLGVIFESNQVLSIAIFSIFFASLIILISKNRYFSKDALIMISSYFCVALAVIINDIWIKNFYFTSYIFGDILTVGTQDIIALIVVTIISISYTYLAFNKILLINLNSDLAKVEKVKTEFWNLSFLILLSLVIAFSVRIVGVFLMTALLILPAAISRIFAISPKQMIVFSFLISIVTSCAAFFVASNYELTVSSTIIVIFSGTFFIALLIKNNLNS